LVDGIEDVGNETRPSGTISQMKIEGSIVLVVQRSWANLRGVRLVIREGKEINEGDDSHVILARVLESEDSHGLWVELNTEKHKQDPSVKLLSVMIPWTVILMVGISKEFAPHLWKEARKAGFITEEEIT
jgi:hypothetical protein